jgi:hypothetical protein
MGTGAVAENVTDTALGTQVETRATGTQVEGASANIYRTVATITATASRAITEHGVFSASTGGTLLDRSVFKFKGDCASCCHLFVPFRSVEIQYN